MALNASAVQVGSAAIAADITVAKLHTGDPGAAGTSNQTTAGQQPISLSSSGGNITLNAPVDFTGGAANGPCTHVSLWGGGGSVYRGSYAIPETDDLSFNAEGEYTLKTVNINGSSS